MFDVLPKLFIITCTRFEVSFNIVSLSLLDLGINFVTYLSCLFPVFGLASSFGFFQKFVLIFNPFNNFICLYLFNAHLFNWARIIQQIILSIMCTIKKVFTCRTKTPWLTQDIYIAIRGKALGKAILKIKKS